MGCAEQDDHVPLTRVNATRQLLEKAGASMTCDVYPGTEHKIYAASSTKVRCLFTSLLAKQVGCKDRDPFQYLNGYCGLHESEALPDTVPRNQRSPREVPHGLVTEVISGSPFCAPRNANLSTWFYRIHPSIGTHGISNAI
jgi:hypothetical protein